MIQLFQSELSGKQVMDSSALLTKYPVVETLLLDNGSSLIMKELNQMIVIEI